MLEREDGPAYNTRQLTPAYARAHQDRLAAIASEIPNMRWTPEMILAGEVAGRPLLGKWEHSMVLADMARPVGLAIGYECQDKDGISAAIHLSALACDSSYKGQGLGEQLLQAFLKKAIERGYTALQGEPTFSLQTRAGEGNSRVRQLYKKYGFHELHEVVNNGELNVVMAASAVEARI